MGHYVDIDLRPDPEFPVYQLMNALYAKLHRALVAIDSTQIGVSFPGVQATPSSLGTRLRLHGSSASLEVLQQHGWLAGMRDHISISIVNPVPRGAMHCAVRRVQSKSNPE